MITAKDTEYHPRDPSNWRWTETTPLIFSVPEENILGNIYVACRPNLGVALSTVTVGKGFYRHMVEVDFSDAQMHLPAPKSFSKYELPNGLSVEAINPPRDFHFKYAYNGEPEACSLDLTFKGLHEPYDSNDPDDNPLLKTKSGHDYDARFGDQWGNPTETDKSFPSGHFETMGHITGELVLRGRTYKVDCFDAIDHSWGRRTEYSTRAVAFLTAVFGPDFGIHLAVPLDVKNGRVIYEGVRFGWVMEDGQKYGVVDAQVTSNGEVEFLPVDCHVIVTDVRGKKHEIFGSAIASHPYNVFNPAHFCLQSLMRWRWGDRIGYSELGNIFGNEFLADRLSRTARKG